MVLNFNHRPKQLLAFINHYVKWFAGCSLLFLSLGLFLSFWGSPADYQQGETVRIMYLHVPCSWGAMATYFLMAIISGYGFIKQVPLASLVTKAMAPIGLCLCLISLITGSIWGKPTWGAWWVWDARLTSMLILGLLYLAYLLLTHTGVSQNDRIAGFIVIIGSINLPIIKWSVDWWHTLHQPASVMRFAKSAIHWQMLVPLFVMTVALACLSITLFLIRLRSELNYRRLLAQQLKRPYAAI
ncbi:heme ABC transporter permease CcmC [Candidatus Paracaedibacter symbiosus]|uniref:heme ABC transporter permease CcmC n=1 Tax=Candidatus Paracaedibacter symbiosus TaxID=244582 RepID=UPI000509A3C1|nr:heme ABC transporter permease CcmC [Candidatus Paracaedibacter symbiosus]